MAKGVGRDPVSREGVQVWPQHLALGTGQYRGHNSTRLEGGLLRGVPISERGGLVHVANSSM